MQGPVRPDRWGSDVSPDVLFDEVAVGSTVFRNRLIRAGTSESMADPDTGTMTPPLLDLYERLAANRVGGIITGHLYVHPRVDTPAVRPGSTIRWFWPAWPN